MPTIISHSLAALVFGNLFSGKAGVKFWTLSVLCAVLPDIDVAMFLFGIPYQHTLGHRGISHSLLFALCLALIIVTAGFHDRKRFSKAWWILVTYFFTLGASHGILDAMTSGGLGVGFFMPFSSERIFFPVRPIRASPFQIVKLFSTAGQRIIVSELLWIWTPAIIAVSIIRLIKKRQNNQSKNTPDSKNLQR